MSRVRLDDGSDARRLQVIGARLLGHHPACGHDDSLYVNPETMTWFCFHCRARGAVLSFQQIESV